MPGGKVAVYSGILPVCKSETGLAVVLGHEITHALNGHSAEQISNAMMVQYGGQIVGGSISNNQWKSVFNELYPVGAQVGLLKFGRNMELDADKGGLLLMAMAGYDPREAIPFWQRMEQATAGNQAPPEFLSTHPNPGNRIAQLQELMPQAIAMYDASPYKGK
jgi:predicted Zn-dependent protease